MLRKEAKVIEPQFYNPLKIFPGIILGYETVKHANPEDNPNGRGQVYKVTKVFYRTSAYAIFEVNNSNFLEYITVDDQKFTTQSISLQLNRIEFWLKDSRANIKKEGKFLETIADAIALCFENKPQEAIKTIVELETMIKNEVFSSSKMLYMIPFIFLVGLMILGSILLQFDLGTFSTWNKHNTDFHFFFHLCTMGAIGGLLSVSRNLDAYNIEIKLKKSIWESLVNRSLVAVVIRFLVSIAGAVVIYVFIKCEIFKPEILSDKNHFTLYALAVVAGFSENLIPSLMTKFETNLLTGEATRVKGGGSSTSAPTVKAQFTPVVSQGLHQEAVKVLETESALGEGNEERAVG